MTCRHTLRTLVPMKIQSYCDCRKSKSKPKPLPGQKYNFDYWYTMLDSIEEKRGNTTNDSTG